MDFIASGLLSCTKKRFLQCSRWANWVQSQPTKLTCILQQWPTALSTPINWIMTNYDQKDSPEGNWKRNVKHGMNRGWMGRGSVRRNNWREDPWGGTCWGHRDFSAIHGHICVLFSRHPCGEIKDSKEEPDGARRAWRDREVSHCQSGTTKTAQTWPPHWREPWGREEDGGWHPSLPVMHDLNSACVLENVSMREWEPDSKWLRSVLV